ncbi:MAG: nucleoside-diphosphate kinase [Succinivibrionaceae bacterium]
MAIERTLSIIKPDVVARDLVGDVYHRFENAGLRIIAAKMVHLRPEQAMLFYAQLRDKKFFMELVDYMVSGPVMISVLEGDDAVRKHREIIGDTDPRKARSGTIRSDYARSIEENAVHGSDSVETAENEIHFFFSESEICPRSR